MQWRSITRLFGILLMLYSLSFVPSIGIGWFYQDGQADVFILSLLISFVIGMLLYLPNRRDRGELSVRGGFLVVSLFWIILGVVGALPFILGLHLNVTDAVFESVSGFTTTGATVVSGLDHLPRSILYHRQQIQWLGGMGIVVLAVAVLPLLGVGGMQLYRAEVSGVTKDEKMTPRITETARALWFIYVALTVLCALAFWWAGMRPFDAIGHAFTTVATGGFSTHDASIGYYRSVAVESVAIVFMLAGGVNFTIHFLAWRRRDIWLYWKDIEVRGYLLIFFVVTILVAITLYTSGLYPQVGSALRYAAFQVASILTSTGYGTDTFAHWPLHLPLLLVILSFTGGCAGSTAGGIKVMRILLLAKLGLRQLFLLAHPRAVSVVKFGQRAISEQVLFSVWGFYVLYIVSTLLLTVAMMATGLSLETAFGAVVATINLLGPGLGEVATDFTTMSDTVKWLGVFGMLVGRLEVFTLLILFLPSYWRH